MPVTITAGITFSGGGLTMEFAPPAGPTAGWFGGGYYPGISTVQRITYATDTATATTRGPLSSVRYTGGATGTFTQGWFGGGDTTSNPGVISTVDRITYATDTATASIRGPLNSSRNLLAATGNTTDGWFVGGNTGPAPTSTVQRITYATDTATASIRGPLGYEQGRMGSVGNTTDGWFAGGSFGTGGNPNSGVQRITYATDTATASARGPLTLVMRYSAGAGTSTQGWIAGQADGAPNTNVQRITYATDTATASVRGPLSVDVFFLAASTDDTTYGWWGGGLPATSVVQRITYATDTVTASLKGPLTAAKYGAAASSGIQ